MRDREPACAEPAAAGREAAPAGRGAAIAYAFINRRERTVSEVRERLARAEVSEAEAESVLDELISFGYLDDARYARLYAQDRQALDSWGRERIARALAQRGVAGELIEAALAAAGADDAAERARAVGLLDERFPTGPREQRDRERAYGLLVRRGYDSEAAADAVREWRRRAR